MRFTLAALAILTSFLLTACGTDATSPPAISITDAWARPAPDSSRPSAAYFTLHNDGGTADTLLDASTPAARAVEVHASTTDERGVMRMRPVKHVAIPEDDSIAFRPGGLHLMLVGLTRPMEAGNRLPLMLSFARHDRVQVTLEVRQR